MKIITILLALAISSCVTKSMKTEKINEDGTKTITIERVYWIE